MRSQGRTGSPAVMSGMKNASRWEPLSTVEPNPVADHDPFSLGDSDEEKDGQPASKTMDATGATTTAAVAAGKTDSTPGSKNVVAVESREGDRVVEKSAGAAKVDILPDATERLKKAAESKPEAGTE